MNKFFTLLLLVLAIFPLSFAQADTDADKLYVTVVEQVGNASQIITKAKVSLSYVGAAGSEQSQPIEWKDVPTVNGKAVFSGLAYSDLADSYKYTISITAPGYLAVQKEFNKLPLQAGRLSVALTKAPEGSVGSVRITVLTQAPQSPIAILTAEIQILRAGKLIVTGNTKNTKGKEGVVFSNLPIGEDYEIRIVANSYESQAKKFSIEANKETWLPIAMIVAPGKPSPCPTNCKCDKQDTVISCSDAGKTTESDVHAVVTSDMASEKAVTKAKLSSVEEVKQIELNSKPAYEIVGITKRRLFFIFPVSFSVKTIIDAATGNIEKTEKPWWSFLAR